MDEIRKVPTDETPAPAPDMPEDVAVLYAWANVQGGTYRDFSAERRAYRAQIKQQPGEAHRADDAPSEDAPEAMAVDDVERGLANKEAAPLTQARAPLRQTEHDLAEAQLRADERSQAFADMERNWRDRAGGGDVTPAAEQERGSEAGPSEPGVVPPLRSAERRGSGRYLAAAFSKGESGEYTAAGTRASGSQSGGFSDLQARETRGADPGSYTGGSYAGDAALDGDGSPLPIFPPDPPINEALPWSSLADLHTPVERAETSAGQHELPAVRVEAPAARMEETPAAVPDRRAQPASPAERTGDPSYGDRAPLDARKDLHIPPRFPAAARLQMGNDTRPAGPTLFVGDDTAARNAVEARRRRESTADLSARTERRPRSMEHTAASFEFRRNTTIPTERRAPRIVPGPDEGGPRVLGQADEEPGRQGTEREQHTVTRFGADEEIEPSQDEGFPAEQPMRDVSPEWLHHSRPLVTRSRIAAAGHDSESQRSSEARVEAANLQDEMGSNLVETAAAIPHDEPPITQVEDRDSGEQEAPAPQPQLASQPVAADVEGGPGEHDVVLPEPEAPQHRAVDAERRADERRAANERRGQEPYRRLMEARREVERAREEEEEQRSADEARRIAEEKMRAVGRRLAEERRRGSDRRITTIDAYALGGAMPERRSSDERRRGDRRLESAGMGRVAYAAGLTVFPAEMPAETRIQAGVARAFNVEGVRYARGQQAGAEHVRPRAVLPDSAEEEYSETELQVRGSGIAEETAADSGDRGGPVHDTLQHSRERMAARWFTLRALTGKSADEGQTDAVPYGKNRIEVRTPVLAVVAFSGGVGKTSLVATLGRLLSSLNEKVLMADTGLYGLLPYYFGAREARPDVVRTFTPPPGSPASTVYMVNYSVERLNEYSAAQASMAAELSRDARDAGRILLDLDVSSAWVARMLTRYNAQVLVPLSPDMNSVLSMRNVERFFAGISEGDARQVAPFYVLNQFDSSQPLHLDVREVLRQQLGNRLLPVTIRRSNAVAEALAEGMTVVDYAPDAAVTADYMHLAEWVRSLSAPAVAGQRSNRWTER